ncbi:MAG: deoxyribodipyrimidine photolyase, partial [Myxococcales bacterium]|nr:deoxyribodipyrimidine photolyase [Myxococcales bacterium]
MLDRLTVARDLPVRADARYVLYWMIAARRTRWSFALDHALDHARRLGVPLLVLEPLRIAYPWAAPRHHRFVVQGMADQRAAFEAAGVRYLPYVERTEGEGHGLLHALARDAAVVVTDHFPTFFLPRMVAAAARDLPARLEVVDGNGLLPLSAAPKAYPTAALFRRHLHKTLPDHLGRWPVAEPLATYDLGRATLPEGVLERWRPADDLLDEPDRVRDLVTGPGFVGARGGQRAAAEVLGTFLDRRLERYPDRNHPDDDAASGLSPWLHFGHVSAHEVAKAVLDRESWDLTRLGRPTGSRAGWWGLSEAAEGFLDELVTWRETGFVYAHHVPDHDRFGTLPDWARATLAKHASDPRPEVYDLATLEEARTGDPLWNAAQRELRHTGRMHNYLR